MDYHKDADSDISLGHYSKNFHLK